MNMNFETKTKGKLILYSQQNRIDTGISNLLRSSLLPDLADSFKHFRVRNLFKT